MNKFRGWKSVFSFNFKQSTSSKGYVAVTALVAIVIIAVAILLSVLAAKPEEEDEVIETSYCNVETSRSRDCCRQGKGKRYCGTDR